MLLDILCKLGGHKWGELEYVKDGSCEGVLICKRNPEHRGEEVHTKHEWVWEYVEDGSCKQVRVCKRNPEHREERESAHQWGQWEEDSESKWRTCIRCNETEYEPEEPYWSDRELWEDWRSPNPPD